MKLHCPTYVGWKVFISAITIIVSCMFAPAYCQNQNSSVALLLQQTPNKGGTTTPTAGVYHFDLNSEVTLTAVPKPGYKFTYWMGDVSDQAATSTVVYLDKPKIIVAIFEQTEYSVQSEQDTLSAGGGGGGGGSLIATSPYIGSTGSMSSTTSSKKMTTVTVVSPTFPQGTYVIPEPATGILLTLGSVFVFARRRRRRHYSNQ